MLINELKLKSDPIERKFLVVLDENNHEITDTSQQLTKVIGANKTLKIDYKDHFVYECISLDLNKKPKYSYKFVTHKEI